jgi:hypothetical protein
LITVRRAILRVAFLAEVVLAISQIPSPVANRGPGVSMPTVRLIDPDLCFRTCSLENAVPGAVCSHAAKLKEQRRDRAHRLWLGLIEAAPCSVNGLHGLCGPVRRPPKGRQGADEVEFPASDRYWLVCPCERDRQLGET